MKKILIVDDSTFMRNIIKDLLTSNSEDKSVKDALEIYEADGKKNAIIQVTKVKPDAILLDIVMEESTTEGIEFLEEINPFFDLSKIIMVSSIGQPEIVNKCKKLGVAYYIQKPIEHEQVIKAVNSVLK